MDRNSLLKLLFGLVIVIALLLTFVITLKVYAQNQFSTDIAERLIQEGVSVRQVKTISRLPYEIEISLQSSSTNNHLAFDDNWSMQLARREATFSYRISTRVESYKLTVYNSNNELIYSTQAFLYPQDLDQQIKMKSPSIDAVAAKGIISDQLQLGDLNLDRLEINPDVAIGSKGQILIISVSAIDLETVNKSLPRFLGALFKILDTINEEHGTYIVLCHLRVLDKNGNILLDYVRDVESGSAQWTTTSGVYDDWFPSPDKHDKSQPTSTPVKNQYAYPAPIESYGVTGITTPTPPQNDLSYPPSYP